MGSGGITYLSKSIGNLQSLQILSLEDNRIGVKGAMSLAVVLPNLIQLTEL